MSVPVPVSVSGPGISLLLAVALLPALLPALSLATPAPQEREAHPLAFRSSAARGRVKLGEPFDYTVEIRHLPEERYALRPAPALQPFTAGPARCRREAQANEAITTCTLPLSLFALGEVDVPALTFDVEAPGGKAVLRVPGPRISAAPVTDPDAPAESLRLRDLAPPVPVWVRSLAALWWAFGTAAAAALALLCFRAARSWRRRHRVAPPPPTPAERFERQLDALAAERLVERGQGSEHLARLAELTREYLAAVAAVPALELTTRELLAALRRAPDARLRVEELEVFLDEADRVKFAQQPAEAEACAAGLSCARGLLERTRPAPALPAPAARRRGA
jgi:hypothetical protein